MSATTKASKPKWYQKKPWSFSPRFPLPPPSFYTPLRHSALIVWIRLHQFIGSLCNGYHRTYKVRKSFCVQNFNSKYCNMAGTKTCNSCNAQRWENSYEGGGVCRTCFFGVDLQVAAHIIRYHQPHMLSVLDSVLTTTRTLGHRIVYQECLYSIKREKQQEFLWLTQTGSLEKTLRMGHQELPSRTKQAVPKLDQCLQEPQWIMAAFQSLRIQFQFPTTENGDWFHQAPTLTAKSPKERSRTQLQQG